MLGSVPLNWFRCKRRPFNIVRLFIENGIGPVRALSDRSSRESLPSFPIDGEISPESLFCCKKRLLSTDRFHKSSGMGPEIRLSRRERIRREERRPSVPDGIGPTRPTPGKWSSVT